MLVVAWCKKVMFFMEEDVFSSHGSHSPPNVVIGRIRHPAFKKAIGNVIVVREENPFGYQKLQASRFARVTG
jgi:hypothetical protein